jgi:hypothetical protein
MALAVLLTGSACLAFAQQTRPEPEGKLTQIDSISIAGNKITREAIILREIIFKTGDRVEASKMDSLMARSRENLINTSLFNFVDIACLYLTADSLQAAIRVSLTERWYIWPTPILKISDRNFNVWWETKDLSRLSYGFYIDWRNFRGRKENLVMKFQWGYNRLVNLDYRIPYLNRKKTVGMGLAVGYGRQRESAYRTVNNKQEFFTEPDGFVREDISASMTLTLRPDIHNTHHLRFGYENKRFSDSLVSIEPDFSGDSATKLQYLVLDYTFKCDHRDYKHYPLKGYYFDVEVLKNGLWTFRKNTLNTFHVMAAFRKYITLHPRIFFASGLNGKLSAGFQPYFILRGIGYDRDIVRSYEYYLVDAQHFAILKNNVKFALIPQKTKKVKFIRNEKFGKVHYALYMNFFLDAAYGYYNQDFGKETNNLQNELLLGYGAGLDFVTYYDVVVRAEFSLNKMGEAGFFLHFTAPI